MGPRTGTRLLAAGLPGEFVPGWPGLGRSHACQLLLNGTGCRRGDDACARAFRLDGSVLATTGGQIRKSTAAVMRTRSYPRAVSSGRLGRTARRQSASLQHAEVAVQSAPPRSRHPFRSGWYAPDGHI